MRRTLVIGYWSLIIAFLILASLPSLLRADATDEYVTAEMQRRQIPGLCLGVIQNGKLIKHNGYGLANLELNSPVTTNTVFEIGSITKQFTAALILMLVESGKLALDDAIAQHLQDTPESWHGVTVRHLLTHTSGIKNYTGLDGFEVRQKLDAAAFIRRLGKEPADFKPGERFSYCNSGYSLLGYIIEQKTGASYWTALRDRILGPIEMDKTQSRDSKAVVPNRASGYERESNKLVNRDADLTDVFAAGAIVSTVGDLARWNAALDAGAVLTTQTRSNMWAPVTLNSGEKYPYGFGWRLDDYNGRRNIGHSGSTSGFSASLQRFPDDRLAVIVLCNLGEQGVATKIAKGAADLYLPRGDSAAK